MERIHNLLRKLQDIYYKQEEKQVIDLDLMLDYTRVLYADLLDARTDMLAKQGMGLHLKPEIINREPETKANPLPKENEAEVAIDPEEDIVEEQALPVEEAVPTPAVPLTEIMAEEEVTVPEVKAAAEPAATEMAATGAEAVAGVVEEETIEEEEDTKEQHVINDDDYPRLDSDILPVKEEPVYTEIHFELPEVKDNASESPKQAYVFQQKIKDIRSFIGINDKYQYMNELFANNKTAYEESLDKIVFCNDFTTAQEWLSTTAMERYGWQKDDETYLSLVETVRKYFAA
ncbi:MAG: hypothetical protein EOP54_02990 [Sphingobacteriales bacterium]|nr:MAG: hypothetical protein EOP54_02990 [Sphingobacteriales bacterium]